MRGERGLLERLRGGEVLVGDGAIGVRLGAYGHRPGECPERWSLDHPEALRAIHAGYIAAGADVVLTNTLGGSRAALGRYGLAGEVEAINRGLAELLAETIAASGRRAHLAGDVGPTGELLAPYGALGEREAVATFREQITALLAGGAEVVFIETMMDLGEAVAAVRAARACTDGPVIATMAFGPAPGGYRTMMGVTPDAAVEGLLAAGADVVGANCGRVTAAEMPGLVRAFRAAGAPLVAVEPNAGLPALVDGATVFSETPEQMAAAVPDILAAGARLVGGCCGTTDAHIRAIAVAVRAAAPTSSPAAGRA
jgi:5-methyltetrahydrofolate--homocysteine methyltransferase